MIKDVFVPSRFGNYYLFNKKVLSIEITAVYVKATLLSFSKQTISFEKCMTIALQDQNSSTVVFAIKKIISQMGSYDELVTSLASSAIIFKELKLPFLGREKIAMVIPYEVEPLLPVSIEDADLDFIVTHEDTEKKVSTVFVAAVKKVDMQHHLNYFEKAGIDVDVVTIDMFALYDFYKNAMYVPQSETSYVLVDFAVDAIRILYLYQGQLQSVRLVPAGIATIMHKMKDVPEAMQHRLLDVILQGSVEDEDGQEYRHIIDMVIQEFSKQLQLSLSFFQKHVKNFVAPSKIFCLGDGTGLHDFKLKAQSGVSAPIDVIDMKKVVEEKGIFVHKRIDIQSQGDNLIVPLSAIHFGEVNLLLSHGTHKNQNLLLKQIVAAIVISIFSIAGIYLYSSMQIQSLNTAYLGSKKQVVRELEDQMGLDVRKITRPSLIVDAARETVDREKKLWFSFSKHSENSFLEYLYDLNTKIDRNSLGLDLKQLSMNYEEIMLQGKVKDFDALSVFEEELMELTKFSLLEKPRELTFTVKLKVKDELKQS